jgi:HKD family nuclease
VEIRLVLDPNKDAFGYRKNGIPNRQTGHELVRRSDQTIKLRWYDTHGEQFHTKLFMHESGGELKVILGSANLTRRNLDNFNLELDIELTIDARSDTALALNDYFERIWNNEDGLYTVEQEAYQDDSPFKRMLYRAQERFGLSTF